MRTFDNKLNNNSFENLSNPSTPQTNNGKTLRTFVVKPLDLNSVLSPQTTLQNVLAKR